MFTSEKENPTWSHMAWKPCVHVTIPFGIFVTTNYTRVDIIFYDIEVIQIYSGTS